MSKEDIVRVLEKSANSRAALPEWQRTNFGQRKESREELQRVVIAHLKEARKAAVKLDMEVVVKTIDILLE